LTRIIYIREIIIATKEPMTCPTCLKNDKLEKNIIFERRSDGQTIICTQCEALTIITSHNLKKVDLESSKDFKIMLKEPHLMRKITY
jgi:hypothetical protein